MREITAYAGLSSTLWKISKDYVVLILTVLNTTNTRITVRWTLRKKWDLVTWRGFNSRCTHIPTKDCNQRFFRSYSTLKSWLQIALSWRAPSCPQCNNRPLIVDTHRPPSSSDLQLNQDVLRDGPGVGRGQLHFCPITWFKDFGPNRNPVRFIAGRVKRRSGR